MSVWRHKKYGKRNYRGTYVKESGERVLYLVGLITKQIKKDAFVRRCTKFVLNLMKQRKSWDGKRLNESRETTESGCNQISFTEVSG
jgi:hypothetical protein